MRTGQLRHFGRNASLHLILLVICHHLNLVKVQIQLQTFSVDFQEFGTNLFDSDCVVKEDLHLFMEVFDALGDDQFVYVALNGEPLLDVLHKHQLLGKLHLLLLHRVELLDVHFFEDLSFDLFN